MEIIAMLLTWQNLVLACVAIGLIKGGKAAFPSLFQKPSVLRTVQMWPEMICTLGILVPGVSEIQQAGPKMMVGFVVGMFASKLYDNVHRQLPGVAVSKETK